VLERVYSQEQQDQNNLIMHQFRSIPELLRADSSFIKLITLGRCEPTNEDSKFNVRVCDEEVYTV
jgi:hypothetical protein